MPRDKERDHKKSSRKKDSSSSGSSSSSRSRSRSNSDERRRRERSDRKSKRDRSRERGDTRESKRDDKRDSRKEDRPRKSDSDLKKDRDFQKPQERRPDRDGRKGPRKDEMQKLDEEAKQELEKITYNDSDLIASLKADESFLMKEFNEREREKKERQNQDTGPRNAPRQQPEAGPTQEAAPRVRPEGPIGGRTGGVYIPPHKLAQLQQEMLQQGEKNSVQHQKLMWELLRKSINGIINKVNISNIQNIIVELLNENIMRGKGLLAKAIIKAQMASPNFTHVYAALIAVINTKLPDIADLIIRRVILQFQKAYSRNNKIVCMATTRMLAHLINQKVLSDFAGLQMLALMLENPTEDSVEIACDFMVEVGQVLSELTPAGVNSIFERFKGILHEGEIDRRVQYSIENLFAIRKSKFAEHTGVIPELDLVEEEDQITHQISIDDSITGEEMLNIFKYDPFYEKTEEEWAVIKNEILGEENIIRLKTREPEVNEEEAAAEEEEAAQQIHDMTETDLINLRRTIYLTIMNSVDFEECAHKLLKLELTMGREDEVCNMITECCMQERTYLRFYGLLSQRFCQLIEIYQQCFFRAFVEKYTTIHRYETNKLRNIAKLMAHLLYTNAIDWRVLSCITITQEGTTSSSRIYLKIFFQELAENMGLETLNKKLQDPELEESLQGVFPKDHPKDVRFAINFFTLIGLGGLTVDMRNHLKTMAKPIEMEMEGESSSSGSDSDSDSSSSGSDSSGSDSDSDRGKKNSQKKRK